MNDQSNLIGEQNDRCRKSDPKIPCRVMITTGVQALISEHETNQLSDLLKVVGDFDEFDADNDPYGERDFGAFDFLGKRLFWKIDPYDCDLRYRSNDPADLTKTIRVLTIMLALEY